MKRSLATREEEARLHTELAMRQAADAQAKQERSKRKTTKKADEPELPPVVAEVAKVEQTAPVAAAPAANLAEGTLHKPTPKPGDKIAKPSKKPKPEVKSSPWDGKGAQEAHPGQNR